MEGDDGPGRHRQAVRDHLCLPAHGRRGQRHAAHPEPAPAGFYAPAKGLGVHHPQAGGADDEMIYVGAAAGDGEVVQDRPARRRQMGQESGRGLLACRAPAQRSGSRRGQLAQAKAADPAAAPGHTHPPGRADQAPKWAPAQIVATPRQTPAARTLKTSRRKCARCWRRQTSRADCPAGHEPAGDGAAGDGAAGRGATPPCSHAAVTVMPVPRPATAPPAWSWPAPPSGRPAVLYWSA